MNKAEIAALRQHYLKEMVERVSIVEGLTLIINEAEDQVMATIDPNTVQDPEYLMDQILKPKFTHQKNKAKRDRLREEAKMFALAAEALRP